MRKNALVEWEKWHGPVKHLFILATHKSSGRAGEFLELRGTVANLVQVDEAHNLKPNSKKKYGCILTPCG